MIYCAAVGTIDPPDARYVGPRESDAIAKGLEVALGMPERSARAVPRALDLALYGA
jgi:hypothetical protein